VSVSQTSASNAIAVKRLIWHAFTMKYPSHLEKESAYPAISAVAPGSFFRKQAGTPLKSRK